MPLKRLSPFIFSLLVISFLVILGTRHSSGETSLSKDEQRIKVLRRKGQINLKPTTKEITSLANSQQKEERELDDQIPKHLPIKVRIKAEKEKAFKDVDNQKWMDDFELEVRNTGDKPIYFLSLFFILPDVTMPDGNQYGFSLHYGRSALIDITERLNPEDVPIQKDESYIFRIPAYKVKNWQRFSRDEKRPQPRKVRLAFSALNFGDGTGFVGTTAAPLGKLRVQLYRDVSYEKGEANGFSEDCIRKRESIITSSTNSSPAKYSPAIFLKVGNLNSNVSYRPVLNANLFAEAEIAALRSPKLRLSDSYRSSSAPDVNCAGTSCSFLKRAYGRCYCSDPEFPHVDDKEFSTTANGPDPNGHCGTLQSLSESCYNPCCNIPLYCTQQLFIPCGGTPAPTPAPTATPTPTPTPETCDPATRPNNTNCSCVNVPGIGLTWQCSCGAVQYADYVQFPQSGGCDPNTHANNGSNCCVCIAQNVPCDPGYVRNSFTCGCVPNPMPTPTPPTGGGGGGGEPPYNCTPYYWVLYDCQPVGETDWNCTQVTMWEAGCW